MGQLVARAERGAMMRLSATTVTAMYGRVLLFGRFNDAVFCVGLCFLSSPFALALSAHGCTPALAARLVCAPLQE